MKNIKVFLLLFIVVFLSGYFISLAQQDSDSFAVHFFYSPTCPHCHDEALFLDQIEEKYPEINIERYNVGDIRNHDLLKSLAEEHDAERFLGSVPMTFIGEDFFLGFDNAEGIGKDIENSIKKQIGDENQKEVEKENIINLPFIGVISLEDYSILGLSIIFGLLDGFNVCSLGALILILGLVISLRSRKRILILGGTFILSASIVYGLLIFLWYKLFSLFSGQLVTIQFIVGIISIIGGLYFLNEFKQFKKYGPTCKTSGTKLVSKLSGKVQKAFDKKLNIFFLSLVVLFFAVIITLVEFPCSAAIPVVFTGILAQQNLSALSYIFYIVTFIIFYMIDELIIFFIAVWKMDIWLMSPKSITWLTLIEALILISFGLYYLMRIL
ncbi:MAG: hypothetical protein WDZ80_02575 [Candidatus Paceibacterota bacterium]